MLVLIDANILLRMVEPQSSRHSVTVQATRQLSQKHTLVSVPQIAYEFWTVATRTVEANGLGMGIVEADKSLEEMLELFPLLRDERGIIDHWRNLVRDYEIKGVKSHDTRLVAAMQQHGIAHLLTFNVGDFQRYAGITVLTPDAVLANE